MNLVQIVKYIETIALEHPLVKSFYEGSVFEHLNSKEVKYGAFVLTQPDFNGVVKDDNVKRYTFQATYIDRLCEDESNKLVIQTDGINTIHEIFNYIKTNAQTADVEIPITFTTFTQKFADKCGGAYANVVVEVNDEIGSCDIYYEDILIEPIPGTSHTTVLDNYYTKVEVEDLIRNIEHNQLRGRNDDPLFQHINEEQKNKLINNYTYKLLNTPVSTWLDSSTYAEYKYEATITIAGLIEGDFVSVVFGAREASNGNYAPIQQQYDGYIIIYSKENTTITIPTIVVTKILL